MDLRGSQSDCVPSPVHLSQPLVEFPAFSGLHVDVVLAYEVNG